MQEAGNDDVMMCGIYRKLPTGYLNHAKQHQTGYTASVPSEPLPQAPLPQGDALVAYENVKWEKNSEGKENGEIKFDINVCRV
jgi:hypothetical protein